MYFGMELASIFDTFWTFVHNFRFNPSAIEKVWIFIEFPSKIEALEPWKIQLLRGTLCKNTEIANSDFTLFLYPIWDAFWHSFGDLWA